MAAEGIASFATAIGVCAVAWNDRGICGLQLPEATGPATIARLVRATPNAIEASPPPPVQAAIDRVVGLLNGTPDDLADVPVDLGGCSEFATRVYAIARRVGPGETTTYGSIAVELGEPRASREVGQALGRNPVPIVIPCHRVLAAGGKIGGFSAEGGVTTKLRMLAIEDAAVDGQPSLF